MNTYSRRKFLKTAAIGAAGLTIVPNTVLGKTRGYTSPSDKINIAGIGVGGMGRRNLANMKTENIVALCDVDWKYVYEAHCWTDRPIWPQGLGEPKGGVDVPPTLDWDLFIGPAKKTPL